MADAIETTETPGAEDITAVEEMRNIFADTTRMIDKYKRLAVGAAQQGDGITANIYGKVADDILPLFADLIKSTGAFAEETAAFMDEVDDAGLLGEEGEEGVEGAVDDEAPDDTSALVEEHKVEVEALYRLSHAMTAYLEVGLAKNLYAKKDKVRSTAEALLDMCRSVNTEGTAKYGFQPDEGSQKFRAELEAAFK